MFRLNFSRNTDRLVSTVMSINNNKKELHKHNMKKLLVSSETTIKKSNKIVQNFFRVLETLCANKWSKICIPPSSQRVHAYRQQGYLHVMRMGE
jgi:hypothetical protein